MDFDITRIIEAVKTSEPAAVEKPDAEYVAKWADYWTRHGYDASDIRAFSMLTRWCAYHRRGIAQRGLLLRGGNGTGKTMAAEIIAHAFRGQLRSARDIARQYAEHGAASLRGFLTPVGSEYHTALMVIDDVGEEPTSVVYGTRLEIVGETLAEIYDRWKSGGLTIVTTNLSEDELRARYGGRVCSRLAQMMTTVPFTGPDRRLG